MMKVLIPTKLSKVARQILEAKGFTVVLDFETPLDALLAANADAEALIVRSEKVTKAVIDALPKLKVVVRAGAGYDTIDTKYARKRGVDVMNTPGANANAVAEEVLAMMLAYCRHIVAADQSTRAGEWEKNKFMGSELTGKTVGVVGLGNIGQLVVKRLAGFEVKVLGYDPVLSAQRARELSVEMVSLDALFAQSDFVTLHIPENDETRGLVNKDLLGKMKTGAVLVNCARSGVINEDDLREIKKTKKIGFCTDVYPKDAAGPKPVADIADLMLPHIGASTEEANTMAARRSAEQLVGYVEQGVTKFVVNKGVPDELDANYQHLAYCIAAIGHRYLGFDKAVRQIQTSFYGNLQAFSKWFLPPVVAGLTKDFDSYVDPEEAEQYLADKGVVWENRETDPHKAYASSMTIDLLEGDQEIRQVSVRGTITEGKLMISRINDFEGLYFEPYGHSLFVVYEDRPGVLAKITAAVAAAGINIDDIRSPHDSKGKYSLAVLKTNKAVPETTQARIKTDTGADLVFAASLP